MVPTISYTKEDVRQHEALTNLLRLEDIDVVREDVDASTNTITLSCKHRWFIALCPDCGHVTAKVAGYVGQRMVYDAPIRGRNVRLLFDNLKFECVDCGSQFVKPVRDVVAPMRAGEPERDYTYRLVEEVAHANIKDVQTVVNRYGLSDELAQRILKAVKDKVHLKVPIPIRSLGVDEIVDQNGRYDYALVIYDFGRRRVLEILPDQTKLNLIDWLYAPPATVDLSTLESVQSTRGTHLVEAVVTIHPQAIEQSTRPLPSKRAPQVMKEEPRNEPAEREQRRGDLKANASSSQRLRPPNIGKIIGKIKETRPDPYPVREQKSDRPSRDDEHLRYRPAPPRQVHIEPESASPVHEDEDEDEEEPDRYQITIAILIAVITFIGALIAAQAAFAGGNASGAAFAGLQATLYAEQTQSLNKASVLRHYRAYTAYTRHNQERKLLDKTLNEAAGASEEEQENLREQSTARMREEAINLVTTNAIFFPQRYLNRDGSYNIERQEAEMWAQAAQSVDINPEPHSEEAAQSRTKTIQLVAIFIPLSIALLFYTLAEGLHPAQRTWRYVVAVLGSIFLVITILSTIMVELFS